MSLFKWSEVAVERMNPLVSRQAIHGESITVAKIGMRKGALVRAHSHVNEQITMLESGRLRFVIEGKETIVNAGESLRIPPNALHEVEALEDSMATDLFSPIREDLIRGDDAYLR